MLDVDDAGLLMLEEVVDLLLFEVGGNSGVVGFKLVLVMNVINSVDAMTEEMEDKRWGVDKVNCGIAVVVVSVEAKLILTGVEPFSTDIVGGFVVESV